jgi:transcription elongation GreA/GreB family factor
MSKVQEPKFIIQVGSVVQLKSDAGNKARKLTVVGADTFKGTITVIWSSDNGNIGRADIPAAAINIIKA